MFGYCKRTIVQLDRVTFGNLLEDVFRNALKKNFGSRYNFAHNINPRSKVI